MMLIVRSTKQKIGLTNIQKQSTTFQSAGRNAELYLALKSFFVPQKKTEVTISRCSLLSQQVFKQKIAYFSKRNNLPLSTATKNMKKHHLKAQCPHYTDKLLHQQVELFHTSTRHFKTRPSRIFHVTTSIVTLHKHLNLLIRKKNSSQSFFNEAKLIIFEFELQGELIH